MEITIYILFNFIVAIFCIVTGLFLFTRALRTKKAILYSFSIYFLLVSYSLLSIFFYVIIPDIQTNILQIIIFLSILLAYIGVLNLLFTSFYVNGTKDKTKISTEISIAVIFLLLVLGFYPSNVHHFNNGFPELSAFYALLLFVCFSILYILCIWNLKTSKSSKEFNSAINVERYLLIFYLLGIVVTFTEIFSFFNVLLSTFRLGFPFMNIFVFLFIIQGLIIVYSLPLKSDDHELSKKKYKTILNI